MQRLVPARALYDQPSSNETADIVRASEQPGTDSPSLNNVALCDTCEIAPYEDEPLRRDFDEPPTSGHSAMAFPLLLLRNVVSLDKPSQPTERVLSRELWMPNQQLPVASWPILTFVEAAVGRFRVSSGGILGSERFLSS